MITEPCLDASLGLVKFFGNVAHQQPKEICGRFQHFICLVFSLADGDDPNLQVIAMETIGFIGESPEGKLALEKQGKCIVRLILLGGLPYFLQ